MNFDVLIPQIWYDFIGRVIPGTYMLGYCYLAINGYLGEEILNPSFFGVFVILVLAYLTGALMGGIWFKLEDKCRKDSPKIEPASEKELPTGDGTNPQTIEAPVRYKKHMLSFVFITIERMFRNDDLVKLKLVTEDELINAGVKNARVIGVLVQNREQLTPFIYDLIQVKLPKMGQRISKLRGEQLLCGNLFLSSILLCLSSIIIILGNLNSIQSIDIALPVIAFLITVLSCLLKLHLQDRYNKAITDGWLFLQADIKENL